MTIEQTIDERIDQFPVGMRVLAVDDNPTCLMLLETLLRRCQYHVTGSSQARTALKMLRENKERFDLVISDVDMPDMDGFKLLELVGLEMDLPVIMLSAYGDTKLVMKGITHGACDYLLKPVRIEELKNIWQHVIRRKRFDRREQQIHSKKVHLPPPQFESAGENDQMKKQFINGRKRGYDLEDENEENGHENDDPSAQKKPRVVWSVELHRKFVAAVNHLGIDRAVPKRILELMNVEKLTRENVASHLQKYRLYLKRISCVASQQADMVAAFANSDSSYLQFGPLNLNPSIGYPNFQNNIYSIIQSGIQHGNILQGMPMNVDLQFHKPIASSSNSSFGVLKNEVDDQRAVGDLSSMLTSGVRSEFTNDINLIGESNCEEQMENCVRCNDGSLEDLVNVMMMKQGNDKVMH